MDERPDREARLVSAAKAQAAAQQRHAEQAAEIAAQQDSSSEKPGNDANGAKSHAR